MRVGNWIYGRIAQYSRAVPLSETRTAVIDQGRSIFTTFCLRWNGRCESWRRSIWWTQGLRLEAPAKRKRLYSLRTGTWTRQRMLYLSDHTSCARRRERRSEKVKKALRERVKGEVRDRREEGRRSKVRKGIAKGGKGKPYTCKNHPSFFQVPLLYSFFAFFRLSRPLFSCHPLSCLLFSFPLWTYPFHLLISLSSLQRYGRTRIRRM